jgi:hypothetical protein
MHRADLFQVPWDFFWRTRNGDFFEDDAEPASTTFHDADGADAAQGSASNCIHSQSLRGLIKFN